ncbi:MAG: hypothetical protein JNG90_05595 [Planctomycetaceae bacterium]|nr:hypothetical protein [Planctomycetaceae bacterium]
MSTATNVASLSASNLGKDDANASAEDYYVLIQTLRAGGMSAVAPRSVGVTCCTGDAGVSSIAGNLAKAAAEFSEQPVLLLDLSGLANSPRPSGEEHYRQKPVLTEVAQPTAISNLFVLRGEDLQEELLWTADLNAIDSLIRSAEDEFGYVVVNLPATDSSVCYQAAGLLNGVLLVVEAERTRIESATRAKNRLIHAQANLLGVVLNNNPQHLPKWLQDRLQ